LKLKACIFDLDGTLLDSMPVWRNLGINYLKSQNIVPPENIKEILKPLSLLQAAQYFRKELGIGYTDNEIITQINRMLEHQYFYNIKEKPGVIEFLEKLKASGVKICVATATDKYLVEAALKRLNILSYFEFIITCTCVGVGKNSPVIYQEALKKLGSRIDETIVFEDALYAIETAKKAGFIVAGIYDASAQNDTLKIKEICDYYIYHTNDLVEMELWNYEKSINNSRL